MCPHVGLVIDWLIEWLIQSIDILQSYRYRAIEGEELYLRAFTEQELSF